MAHNRGLSKEGKGRPMGTGGRDMDRLLRNVSHPRRNNVLVEIDWTHGMSRTGLRGLRSRHKSGHYLVDVDLKDTGGI